MKVIITRPADQAMPLAHRLADLGHEIVLCPLIHSEALGDEPLDLSEYDWVVVTSPRGAAELARRAHGKLPAVAAIGPGTADALRECGIEPRLVPRVSTQEGLLAELPHGERVVLAAAEGARRLLVDELDAGFIALYRTVELEPGSPPDGDLAVLASPSAARAFAKLRLDIPVVSIGPQTTLAAIDAGLQVTAEAKTHDLEGLVSAVAQAR
jgi:uroporphyrinogen-III synthase